MTSCSDSYAEGVAEMNRLRKLKLAARRESDRIEREARDAAHMERLVRDGDWRPLTGRQLHILHPQAGEGWDARQQGGDAA
jgi:hypothetical protein